MRLDDRPHNRRGNYRDNDRQAFSGAWNEHRFDGQKSAQSGGAIDIASARVPMETADIRDHEALCAIIDRHDVTEIIHTAAMFSGSIKNDHLAGISTNIMGTANVLETARKRKLRRAVLASSTVVLYPVFNRYSGAIPEDFECTC